MADGKAPPEGEHGAVVAPRVRRTQSRTEFGREVRRIGSGQSGEHQSQGRTSDHSSTGSSPWSTWIAIQPSTGRSAAIAANTVSCASTHWYAALDTTTSYDGPGTNDDVVRRSGHKRRQIALAE